MKYEVGQRVSRIIFSESKGDALKYGNVISSHSKGRYPELYDVQWDGGKIGRNYLPHGITAVKDEE